MPSEEVGDFLFLDIENGKKLKFYYWEKIQNHAIHAIRKQSRSNFRTM